MVTRPALIVLSVALIAAPALAQRVCEEELAGTCLKWREEAPARIAPAPATPAPQAPALPPEARAERALGLDAAARRRVQGALNRAGYGAGAEDGAFGAQTRRALSAWQGATGRAATGYLAEGEAEALEAAAAPPPAAARAESSPSPPAPPPQAAETLSAEVQHAGSRFVVSARPLDAGAAALTLRITSAFRPEAFEQSCSAPLSGSFDCSLTQPGWNRVQVEGALPEVMLRFDPRTLVIGDATSQDSPGWMRLTLE